MSGYVIEIPQEKENLVAVYLEEEVGGFAVHIVKKA